MNKKQSKCWTRKLMQWFNSVDYNSNQTIFTMNEQKADIVLLCRAIITTPKTILICVADSNIITRITPILKILLDKCGEKRKIIEIPDVVLGRNNQWLPENEARRCQAINKILNAPDAIYITSVASLIAPTISPKQFKKSCFTIKKDSEEWQPKTLAKKLVELDYDNEVEVYAPGEFARRGGIFDIYSPTHKSPVRLDFFGDTIESIRLFNPENQRSYQEIDQILIIPRGAITNNKNEKIANSHCIRNYFAEDLPLIILEPEQITKHLYHFNSKEDQQKWQEIYQNNPIIRNIAQIPPENNNAQIINSQCFGLGSELTLNIPDSFENNSIWHWQQLTSHLLRWQQDKYTLVACCPNKDQLQRLTQLINEDSTLANLSIKCETLPIDAGIIFPTIKLVLLSSREMFGKAPTLIRKNKHYHFRTEEQDCIEMEEGCFAVHASHGICQYLGIKKIETNGEIQEVIILEFAEDAKIYVPLNQSYLVSRYVGGTKKMPKCSKLGSAVWKKAKKNAEDAANDLAAELLRIEAMRQHSKGYKFKKSPDWEDAFARSFPYTETEDQQKAIDDVLADMANTRPMDRLLCGDVGYGKTEIAIRAAFRAVVNGKQVALLVPTTILAQQHYNTFRQRMTDYPIKIQMLSRFRTSKEQKKIVNQLSTGQIDIIIGTHRILQKDIIFNDLGLLIIDEEQRFGVKHKQYLKQMRANVDILTMTATPIPRTLYFSLSGLRHLSTIMTAPAERLPITTIVTQYQPELIQQAINRELEREGQIFVLHNRIKTIKQFASKISTLAPKAKVKIAHGRMSTEELENIMQLFMTGKIDILVSTTIIESGLDIPNANTIIIDRADRFGLAELYQLRGRVGRYHNQAYAYLILPPIETLPTDARQRLAAIRRYTHLGAGFKLAMRDLEIRGAGNILGSEQSGYIASVGFELYSTLLKQAVAKLSNTTLPQQRQISFIMDTISFAICNTNKKTIATIPPTYIQDENLRLNCYQRLNELTTIQKLKNYQSELIDRYGTMPECVETLLQITQLKILANKLNVFSIRIKEQQLYLETNQGFIKTTNKLLPKLKAKTAKKQLLEIKKFLTNLQK